MTRGKSASKSATMDIELDRLTGLLNRKQGEQCLRLCLKNSKQTNTVCTVALIDINDLTEINRMYGHDVGDKVIQIVARTLKEETLPQEYAVRFSGDDFLLICPQKTKPEIQKRIELMLAKLNEQIELPEIVISFCFGVVEANHQYHISESKLIMDCDDAMYEWKRRYHLDKARKNIVTYREKEEVSNFQFDEKRLFSAISQSSDDYFYVCNMRDDPSTFRYSNAMVDEFNLPGEIVHDAARVWGAKIHEGDQQAFLESNQEIVDGRVDFHNVEYRACNKNNEWVWLRCRGHVERDYEGNAVLFAGIITVLGKKNKIDHLTGLFNKYEYEDTVEELVRKQQPFGAMFIDMDGFGSINKLYNHHFGDAVLAKTAQQIQAILPQGVKLFRYDGDEFLMIFYQDVTHENMTQTFSKIQKMLEKQQNIEEKKYHISISAGACFFPEDGIDLMNISKNMSYALEASKYNGKNCLTFFHKKMLTSETRKLDLIEQLRYSIEHDFEGFEMYFQPQVVAATQEIIGAEALTRWKCDLYGSVPPLVFIPLLEQNGMIHKVGRWIFDESLRLAKEFMSIREQFDISINLSYLQITEKDFVNFMKNTIQKYDMDPRRIVVEITESRLMEHNEELSIIFKDIRSLGIRIAMDDFGTGFSSLGVLKRTPADIVKIDKVFVKDVLVSSFDATFIRFVVTLCHDVDINVLLEGVETREEYEKVKEMELDFIQGYFFGRPVPAEELKKKLMESTTTIQTA